MKKQKNMLQWRVLTGWILVISFSAFFVYFSTCYAAPATLKNPLKTDSPQQLIGIIIKGLLGVVGSTALLFFIYGGMTWLTSGGNPEKVKKGRDTLVWAIIGLMVIFSSYILVDYIFKALTST